jgi:hypothetical protein
MDVKGQRRFISLLIVLPMLLNAQLARQHDPVTLKHWVAPLYWQPTQANVDEHAVVPAPNAIGLPATANPLVFVAMPPCRVVDTRTSSQGFTGAFGPPSLLGGVSRTFPILSSTTCTIPAAAQAYSFEITVVPPGPLAYITAFPTGQVSPVAAIAVESAQGLLASNTGIIPAGTNGSVDVYASNPTDIVIDINGYYSSITGQGDNTALGLGALSSDTLGSDPFAGTANTAIGYYALTSNTTGRENTASGTAALGNNTTGNDNTANGHAAMNSNTTGLQNTASGSTALNHNTTGSNNTAIGFQALYANTSASQNTATGALALQNDTTGNQNTANGADSLQSNTTGLGNTASGYQALQGNTTGNENTAAGSSALQANTTGSINTANGGGTLGSNTTGNENAAVGVNALSSNTTGSANTAFGGDALLRNTTGNYNTAIGVSAASSISGSGGNITGNNNIAVGYLAASNVSGGNSNNIHMGSQGSSNDNNIIRIGTPGLQTSFFAAGVRSITTGNNDAIPVVIDSNGQLGTVSSSGRFKEEIHDMDTASSGLMRLRPVTFRYQKPFADGSKPIQYGLIAEEVERVYPDLVAHSADGQIETVKYQVLDSMLLNELQKEHQQVEKQAETIQRLESRLASISTLPR